MSLPTPHKVAWKARVLGARDSRGRVTATYAAPVDVPVNAIYPAGPEESVDLVGSNPIRRRAFVLAPSWPGGPRDTATLWGVEWEQQGHPEDFTLGPFGFEPGVRVTFERTEEAD